MLYNKDKGSTRKKLGRFFSGVVDRFSMDTLDLIQAIDKNDTETVRRAMTAGMDPNRTDGIERLALPMAIDNLNEEMIALLLAGGADPNLQGNDGESALYKAVTWAHEPIVKMLLDAGGDPTLPIATGDTPMDFAKHKKNKSMINLLSNPKAATPTPEKKVAPPVVEKPETTKVIRKEAPKPIPKKRPVSTATQKKKERIQKTIELGKTVEAATKKLKENLVDKAKQVTSITDKATKKKLENATAKVKTTKKATPKTSSPKKAKAKKTSTPVIPFIKETGSISGALIKAIQEKEETAITVLVNQIGEKDLNKVDTKTGLTPLLAAIEQKHAKATGALIDKGADVFKSTAKKGHSPLSLAVEMKSYKLVKFMLEKQDPTTIAEVINDKKQKLSIQYIAFNDPKMLDQLIKAGADINFGGKEGTSPLLKGMEEGSIGLLPLYAKHKIDMNQIVEGKSLLEWAIKYNRADWLNGLLSEGADKTIVNKNGQTALDYAESFGEGRVDMVALLKG